MDWKVILGAVDGRADALDRLVGGSSAEGAMPATLLLLLEDAPPAPAALGAVAATGRRQFAPPIQAALAPHIAPALATWRADPHWAERALGDVARSEWAWSVASLVVALRGDPAAQRDAVAIVVRSGKAAAIVRCLAALGAAGWRALGDDLRAALLQKARPDALGWVWDALDEGQRAAATQRAAGRLADAARLIRSIGDAWHATDPTLRETLMNAVLSDPPWIYVTAPVWSDMTAAERDDLARAVIEQGDEVDAFRLLENADGRATLAADRRAAVEALAMEHPDGWLVLAWRAADGGWTALTDEERAVVMAQAEREGWNVQRLLRAVGAAGWRAMRADEQARLVAVVRHDPKTLFRCPPALWGHLAGAALPPATDSPAYAVDDWCAEDADADLDGLPAAHQALVLALAPWRTEDAAPDAVRMQRLRAAWRALPDDARVALATAHPSVLASVAAAARLCDDAAATDAVGATVARLAAATDGADVKRAVAARLRATARWRAWMTAFAPSDGDPPDVGKAWRDAARRGAIPDPALCARLAAKEWEESTPSRALRRTGRRRGARASS